MRWNLASPSGAGAETFRLSRALHQSYQLVQFRRRRPTGKSTAERQPLSHGTQAKMLPRIPGRGFVCPKSSARAVGHLSLASSPYQKNVTRPTPYSAKVSRPTVCVPYHRLCPVPPFVVHVPRCESCSGPEVDHLVENGGGHGRNATVMLPSPLAGEGSGVRGPLMRLSKPLRRWTPIRRRFRCSLPQHLEPCDRND
jgi:hypothetical protein